MSDDDVIRKNAIIEYPAGTELSKSRKSKNGRSSLLRSTDKSKKGVQSHAEIFLNDEHEQTSAPAPINRERRLAPNRRELSPAEKDIVMGAIEYVADAALDRIERAAREWWANRPARLAEKARRPRESARAAAAAEQDVSMETADEAADEAPTIPMTAEDWGSALNALLIARTMSPELWQILAHARIADADGAVIERQRAMTQLTPQEFEDRISELLKENPGLVDEPLEDLLVRSVADPLVICRPATGSARLPAPASPTSWMG